MNYEPAPIDQDTKWEETDVFFVFRCFDPPRRQERNFSWKGFGSLR